MKIKEKILSCWNFFWDVLLRRDVPDNSRWENQKFYKNKFGILKVVVLLRHKVRATDERHKILGTQPTFYKSLLALPR